MMDDAKRNTGGRALPWKRTGTAGPTRQRIRRSVGFLLLLGLCIIGLLGTEHARAEKKGSSGPPPPSQLNKDYLIGPGDVLEIMVWKEPDISRTVTVRLDGKISLPLVDDVQAANHSLLDVKRSITKALRGYVDAPAVYVMLQEARSKKIYVIGKVNSPGEQPLLKSMNLLQAIALAGGFADWADTNDIIIMRKGPAGQLRMKVDYRRAVSGKDIEQNVLLRPDDVIVVP